MLEYTTYVCTLIVLAYGVSRCISIRALAPASFTYHRRLCVVASFARHHRPHKQHVTEVEREQGPGSEFFFVPRDFLPQYGLS